MRGESHEVGYTRWVTQGRSCEVGHTRWITQGGYVRWVT